MEHKHAKPLHKILKGSVCVQWVTCGKPSCKCTRGDLHGPYYYRFWREDGRLRKEYVKREDLAAVQAATRAYHEAKQVIKDSWVFLRQSRKAFRDLKKLLNEERELT